MNVAPIALWVTPVADVGGVGRHVLDVARVGIPGWRVVVLCPEGPLAEDLRATGAAVLTGPVDPASGVAAGVRAVAQAVRSLRPAVVHSHLAHADLLVALGAAGVKRVSTEHGIADDDLVYHGSAARSLVKASAHSVRVRRFDRLIACAAATAGVMRRKWHVTAPITVIPNGVDPVDATPTRGLRFLSLARLSPEKRLPDLLASFALVHGREPAARLTLAGEGPQRAELESLVTDLGLNAVVRLPGILPADEALRTHDVVVQLSVWENCSYALLDALTHGTGVVASAVGGNPEIVAAEALVDATDHEAVAVAMTRQGLELASRPRLPQGWPTVTGMTAAIALEYSTVAR